MEILVDTLEVIGCITIISLIIFVILMMTMLVKCFYNDIKNGKV